MRNSGTTLTPYRPSALRWIVCLALIFAHWFAFESLVDWYVETYVTPRTGLYEVEQFPEELIMGPPITVILVLLAFQVLDRRIMSPGVLLATWFGGGAALAIWSALNEASAGREYWPDVVGIAWVFVFVALIVFAFRARSPDKGPAATASTT